MSKDIRSYFSVSPRDAKHPVCDKKKRTTKNISDSESDDEYKKKKLSKSKSPSTKGSKKAKEKLEKSKYFNNLKPVNPSDVFGSTPVKRSGVPLKQSKNSKKRKTETDKHDDDDDFDDALMQIDEDSIKLLVENKSSENNSTNKSVAKELKTDKNKSKSIHNLQSVPNCIEEVRILSKENHSEFKIKESDSSKKTKDNKIECLELSDSDDSDRKRKSPVKVNVKNKKNSLPVEANKNINNITTNIKKNECMDLSESESEEEVVIKTNKQSPQIKNEQSGTQSSSPKKQKLDDVNKEQQNQRTQYHNVKSRNNDSDKFPQKMKNRKTEIIEIPKSVNSYSPKQIQVSNLWVDKYKPTSIKQLIGQQGDRSNVKKLLNWLQNWKKNHSVKTKLHRPSPWAKDDDGSFFKAALLSGPPGIGKTTTAHLVCKELGYDVVEFNASDTRSKKLLHEEVSELLSTTSLAPYFTAANNKEVSSNHVLLMDEVDGMAGNEDRGGIQELIQLIKLSRVPIICMCNDRNHPKIRSLVNYCFDLRFSRPRVEQIKGAMMTICFKEGLKVTPDQLNEIIRSTNQDIRLVLNHLSVLAVQKDNNLPNSEKYVKLGPWDVLRKVFSESDLKTMSFYDKCDLFFHDYSIAPLFVQENYISVVPHAKLNKIEKIQAFAKAAESICNGDIIEKRIRSSNAWSLLPIQAIFSSVVPGDTLKGHMGGQINFPAWFGKNSTKNKMDRLQQELLVHTRLKVSGSKVAINLDYRNHLRDLIVRPLVQNGSDGVPDALNSLQSYDLLKEDFESLSELCKWPNTKDPMDKVESKVKAAFTRAYNKSSGLSPYAVITTVKKGRGGGNAGIDTENLYLQNDEAVESEEEQEDKDSIEVDAMIVTKKKTSKKQEEPSTSKQKGTGKRGRGSKK
ncbi:germ line transcription factor 1 [Lycorma delicatula]|uniref:germ line transcription factor 1 n=1 Tax=Lycorma delicatula TaxID=130591 RepID=UPI003F5154C2